MKGVPVLRYFVLILETIKQRRVFHSDFGSFVPDNLIYLKICN
jgi:hypothetical protein